MCTFLTPLGRPLAFCIDFFCMINNLMGCRGMLYLAPGEGSQTSVEPRRKLTRPPIRDQPPVEKAILQTFMNGSRSLRDPKRSLLTVTRFHWQRVRISASASAARPQGNNEFYFA